MRDFDEGDFYREKMREIGKKAQEEKGKIFSKMSSGLPCDECGKFTFNYKVYEKNGQQLFLCPNCYEKRTKSGCFITTACVEAKGLSDNCFELETFRTFRDEYVKKLPNGSQLIQEYYKIAPQIVKAIDNTQNSQKIYLTLYKQLVEKSIELIQLERKEEAFQNIYKIVEELMHKYL